MNAKYYISTKYNFLINKYHSIIKTSLIFLNVLTSLSNYLLLHPALKGRNIPALGNAQGLQMHFTFFPYKQIQKNALFCSNLSVKAIFAPL